MSNWKTFVKRGFALVLLTTLLISSADLSVFATENEAIQNEEIEIEMIENEEIEVVENEEIETEVVEAEETDMLEMELTEDDEIGSDEIVTAELVDLGDYELSASDEASFYSASNGVVDLKGGNYEKWINRMNLPNYAISLYNQLSEGSDNDGYKDILISDAAFKKANAQTIDFGSYGKDTFYAIKMGTLKNPTYNQRNYVYKAMRAAFDAYLMDHPEVFWLTGNSRGYCVISGSNYTFYFMLKMHSGSSSSTFDIRQSTYQSSSAIKSDITVRDRAVDSILNTYAVRTASNDYELIKAFNSWLTKNNEYNTLLSSGTGDEGIRAHNCISALSGDSGSLGPVCEGYAKAFKILCDKKNIACVLTVGDAGGGHMWNSVRVNGVWYETDVTWNDPTIRGVSGALSGYENEDYLLVGCDTVIGNYQFDVSHVTTNRVAVNGTKIINGPIISPTRYVHQSGSSYTPYLNGVYRLSGDTRYETSLNIAYEFKDQSNQSKFHSVIIASGKNFADALSGSYLSSQTNAPILMTNGKNTTALKNFINNNLIDGGTIYILGGNAAVSALVEISVYGLGTIERLAGADRYKTNLAILEEAGVENQDILVCTGKSFADSLSASAAKKPLLLVNNKELSSTQKAFLAKNTGSRIYIIGGTGAVNKTLENALKAYGSTERIGGADRYETSVNFARRFFASPDTAVLAYAKNFPDGLCGGSLAMAMNAPLILTANGKADAATEYMMENNIDSGYVLGGSSLISDGTAITIFGL